jgi:DNA-binding CsgD family transcriptional regulator
MVHRAHAMSPPATPDLAGVLEAMGGDALGPALFDWLHEQVALDELFVFERPFDPREAPSSLMSEGRKASAWERTQAYCADFHRLDPINPLLDQQADAARVVTIGSDDIVDLGYRSLCYDRPHFVEKASCWRRGPSHWLVISFFRAEEDGPFQDKDLDAIGRCGRLMFPILAKHQALRRLGGPGRETRRSLIARVEARLCGLPVKLTPRQLEVCSRTAIGMTAEGIGLDLGVKASSVVTHRRRAYDRLGVATGFELTRLLL